jgi:hypothetical protein
VAVALVGMFTEQGPPSILQMDNGGEFSGSTTNHVGHWLLLDDKVAIPYCNHSYLDDNVNI